MDVHAAKDITFDVMVGCSVLHSFLPPYEFLNDFPTAQKYYKLLIYVVGYVALNARSTVYKSISTKDGTTASPAATATAAAQSNGGNGGH